MRTAAALAAAAVYMLPFLSGALAYAAHDVYHLREALGHVGHGIELAGARAVEFRHAHGGEEHSHDAATDALLAAEQHADDPGEGPRAPTNSLTGHLPAHSAAASPASPTVATKRADPDERLPLPPDPPPLPPPRA